MTLPARVGGRARESALSLVVPEAESPTAAFRRRFLARAVARRIPAHVTVLYPFVDADEIDDDLVASLAAFFAGVDPFDFELSRVSTFDAHVRLAPEPRERFVELISATCARFPECPPYGGAFDGSEPLPHLTIGEGDAVAALAATATQELGERLPLAARARAVSLLEEHDDGTWSEHSSFELGRR